MKLNKKKILNEIERLGWSLGRLAKECHVSRQAVQYWMTENNRSPRLGTIQKIADALAIDPKDLII